MWDGDGKSEGVDDAWTRKREAMAATTTEGGGGSAVLHAIVVRSLNARPPQDGGAGGVLGTGDLMFTAKSNRVINTHARSDQEAKS